MTLEPAFRTVRCPARASVALECRAFRGLPLLMIVCGTLSCGLASAQPLVWVDRGPAPNTDGQVENLAEDAVSGAINAVAPHPTSADIVYVGAVNGGIWRTDNAMAADPTWVSQTDDRTSLSIGAIEFDPTDPTHQTLVAGTGRFSSFGAGGGRSGLLRTTDGGSSWTEIDGGGAVLGLNISGVAPRGDTIVLSANGADSFANRGIWRSTNGGASWDRLSNGTDLPTGPSYDLVGDPNDHSRLFTNAGRQGLYRSDDTGATWTKVSDATVDATVSSATNIEFAVGSSDNVFVAVVVGGRLADVFRSVDAGSTWTSMDVPDAHPGRQGSIHLSIAADLSSPNIVYIGGDRQDGPFPNGIGARDYSGRLFRGDASRPSGSQWVHLTHRSTPSGGGTASGSAPHADSRDMDIAANGELIEVDDGGIYRRTSPQSNAGDWRSMNGNLQTAEFHAVAWDANSDIVLGGAQDTGTPQQQLPADRKWRSVSTADGGVTAVDDTSTPGISTRYSSYQGLRSFRRRVYDSSNALVSQVFPSLTVLGGGPALGRQFYTPIALNTVTATRLVIGGSNAVYESFDQGDTITPLTPAIRANSSGRDTMAYGAAGNEDVLYVGSGSRVYVRTTAGAALAETAYSGRTVAGVAIDPNSPPTAYVVDTDTVYRTTDSGATWSDISGDLGTLDTGTFRSIAYLTHTAAGSVAVGSDTGVFWSQGPFASWNRLGTGLPRVPVYHLEYDAADRILLAGTLGRGAWTVEFPSGGDVTVPAGRFAFVWANHATASSYTPSSLYSYNPTGGAITVSRLGTGDYFVRFEGLGGGGTPGGSVQTTAYGSSNHRAKVRWWSSGGVDFVARIRCFDSSGSRVDTRYTVLITWPPAASPPASNNARSAYVDSGGEVNPMEPSESDLEGGANHDPMARSDI